MKLNYKFAGVLVCGLLATAPSMARIHHHIKKSDQQETQHALHNKYYVRGNLNLPTHRKLTRYTTKFKVGGQLAAGWNFRKNLSAELEIDYFLFPIRQKNVPLGDNRKMTSWVAFANIVAHRSLFDSEKLIPFAGIGVGYSRNSIGKSNLHDGSDNPHVSKGNSGSFAYQLFLGIDWAVSHNWSVTADVRWVGFGKVKVPAINPKKTTETLSAQTFTVGVKYKF